MACGGLGVRTLIMSVMLRAMLIWFPCHYSLAAFLTCWNLSTARYVFWVDCCESPHIGRIGMDGSGQAVIIDAEIYSPMALTIDYTTKRLYWADNNHILFANMDGTQRRKGEPCILASPTDNNWPLSLQTLDGDEL